MMITKYFYDEKDYKVVLDLLYKYKDIDKDCERVFARQMFISTLDKPENY